jgi:hypothetical protein
MPVPILGVDSNELFEITIKWPSKELQKKTPKMSILSRK